MVRRRSVGHRIEQWLWSIGGLVIALLPAWIWLAIYKFIGPVGFWEKFVIVGGGLFVFGGLQIIMLVLWCAFLFEVVADK